jgi:cob(I)alamin adenosyltransferase
MGEILKEGLIQVYTGNGKGKTTASFGLALRAIGADLKVAIIQFLKSGKDYSEINSLSTLKPKLTINSFGREGFIYNSSPLKIDYELAQKGFELAKQKANDPKVNVLILDELNVVLHYNFLELDKVLNFLQNKRQDLEIIITGRNAPPEIIEAAHLVTEMTEIKHPYHSGIMARKGIEY